MVFVLRGLISPLLFWQRRQQNSFPHCGPHCSCINLTFVFENFGFRLIVTHRQTVSFLCSLKERWRLRSLKAQRNKAATAGKRATHTHTHRPFKKKCLSRVFRLPSVFFLWNRYTCISANQSSVTGLNMSHLNAPLMTLLPSEFLNCYFRMTTKPRQREMKQKIIHYRATKTQSTEQNGVLRSMIMYIL